MQEHSVVASIPYEPWGETVNCVPFTCFVIIIPCQYTVPKMVTSHSKTLGETQVRSRVLESKNNIQEYLRVLVEP